MEKQVDEVAPIDNNSGSSDNSALHKDDLGRRTKPNIVKRTIEKLRNSGTVKFVLFREDFPKHRVIENITPLHALLIFYLCLFTGLFGLLVLAYATFIGFIVYYGTVAVATLEVLHYLCDK